MSFFKNIGQQIAKKFRDIQEKKREEREFEEKLRQEQRVHEKIEYEKAFRDSMKKAARIKAQRDAGEKTGLAKLRAIRRVEDMKEPKEPIFAKLSEYMQRNIARREANLEKTAKLRAEAEKMKHNKSADVRKSPFENRPFSDLKKGLVKY